MLFQHRTWSDSLVTVSIEVPGSAFFGLCIRQIRQLVQAAAPWCQIIWNRLNTQFELLLELQWHLLQADFGRNCWWWQMDMEIQAVSSTLSDRLWNHFATNIAFSANTFLNSARHGLHLSQIRTEVSSFELVRYTCRRACKSEAVFFWVYLRTGDTPKFDALYQSSSCFLIIFTGFITIYHHLSPFSNVLPPVSHGAMVPWGPSSEPEPQACHGNPAWRESPGPQTMSWVTFVSSV